MVRRRRHTQQPAKCNSNGAADAKRARWLIQFDFLEDEAQAAARSDKIGRDGGGEQSRA